jgi:pyruvate/2-oxoglutarate dehydrogenase complex dihydrolipoamide dehydrogenase (E3) component
VSSELRGDRDSVADHSVFCTVNPAAGREREYRLRRTRRMRQVTVVGGGLAGLEATVTLAQRGHHVRLVEASSGLGGQALLAALVPHKREELGRLLRHYQHEVERYEVDVQLGTHVDVAAVKASAPDAVVVATGELQAPPSLVAREGVEVVVFSDAMRGTTPLAERVVILGGGFSGADTALLLAAGGNVREVTLVTRWPRVLPKMAPINRHVAMKELRRQAHLKVVTGMTSISIESGRVVVECGDGTRNVIEAGTVIHAGGMRPDRSLLDELDGASEGSTVVHAAGGCVGAATFLQAIHGGARVARIV